jgi:RNA polymerase sigma-70 factor (ECF subfamily)
MLIRLHQARVRTFLGRYVRRPDAVDDVAQDTFIDAYKKLKTYRGEAPVRFWLLGIARYSALRYLRDEERRRAQGVRTVETALATLLGRKLASAEEGALEKCEREVQALRQCLGSLPDQSSRLVTEFYYKERTAVEIAHGNGRKESAVWMTLMRIRQALRRCIEGRLKTAEGV